MTASDSARLPRSSAATAPAVPPSAGAADAQRKLFFERMTEIRLVEESLLQLFSEGVLRGTVHTCLGQEATAVGVVGALNRSTDVICSNHRGHGHYLAYCGDVAGLIAEVMGSPEGVCGGVGGSQHLHRDNFYTNGILGGMVPVATGAALAEKHRKSGAVVTVFLGDGAFGEGVVYESLNIAALWQLPILFAVEQNYYAQSTPCELEHSGQLGDRAVSFGIPVHKVDGNDVTQVYTTASALVSDMRKGLGPALMFMSTYRMAAHSKGDDLRDPDEIAGHRANDPLVRLRAQLDAAWCAEVVVATQERIDLVVADLKQQRDT